MINHKETELKQYISDKKELWTILMIMIKTRN